VSLWCWYVASLRVEDGHCHTRYAWDTESGMAWDLYGRMVPLLLLRLTPISAGITQSAPEDIDALEEPSARSKFTIQVALEDPCPGSKCTVCWRACFCARIGDNMLKNPQQRVGLRLGTICHQNSDWMSSTSGNERLQLRGRGRRSSHSSWPARHAPSAASGSSRELRLCPHGSGLRLLDSWLRRRCASL
jgi:hypothetical protein